MSRFNVGYLVGQGAKGLFRNGVLSVAAIAVLMACLVVLGSFSGLLYNININLDKIALLNEIVVIVDYDCDDAKVSEIEDTILALDNIESITFTSKEEALEQEKNRYGEYSDVLDLLDKDNPLPDIFRVRYDSLAGVSTLVYELEHIDGVKKVSNRSDIASDIENVKNGVMRVFIGFLAVLFVVSVFIIINAIRATVQSRSKEITVMRYVGATNRFMMTPFWVEGILIGLFASILAFGIQWYLYNYIEVMISNGYKWLYIVPFADIYLKVLIAFVGIGVLTGLFGSLISLRKFSRK